MMISFPLISMCKEVFTYVLKSLGNPLTFLQERGYSSWVCVWSIAGLWKQVGMPQCLCTQDILALILSSTSKAQSTEAHLWLADDKVAI